MQLKGDSSCGGPAVGMTIEDERLTIRSELHGLKWEGPLMTSLVGGWHSFLLHVNFAKDNTGYLEVVLDGVPQTMVNGQTRIYFPTMCPNDTYVYPKLGVYSMADGAPYHWIESPRIGRTPGSAVPR